VALSATSVLADYPAAINTATHVYNHRGFNGFLDAGSSPAWRCAVNRTVVILTIFWLKCCAP